MADRGDAADGEAYGFLDEFSVGARKLQAGGGEDALEVDEIAAGGDDQNGLAALLVLKDQGFGDLSDGAADGRGGFGGGARRARQFADGDREAVLTKEELDALGAGGKGCVHRWPLKGKRDVVGSGRGREATSFQSAGIARLSRLPSTSRDDAGLRQPGVYRG